MGKAGTGSCPPRAHSEHTPKPCRPRSAQSWGGDGRQSAHCTIGPEFAGRALEEVSLERRADPRDAGGGGDSGDGCCCRNGGAGTETPPHPAGLTATPPHTGWSPSPRSQEHNLSLQASWRKRMPEHSQNRRRNHLSKEKETRGHNLPVSPQSSTCPRLQRS